MQNQQQYNEMIDRHLAQWSYSEESHKGHILNTLPDHIKAPKLLSRNWVCLYPDFIGHASNPDNWIAKTLFNRNHADLLTVRG